ncbi:hypothetical protein FRC18_002502 [Serendipita sp. 400]|nr:hypothetical protein FRC18_002502 [Serendipita sp. 400]
MATLRRTAYMRRPSLTVKIRHTSSTLINQLRGYWLTDGYTVAIDLPNSLHTGIMGPRSVPIKARGLWMKEVRMDGWVIILSREIGREE